VNMQTSFMHPPFGFALFYLRSVAPAKDYLDKITGKLTAKVTTGQIYWGAVPFVLIQIIMVGMIIAFPGIVSNGIEKAKAVDMDQIRLQMESDMVGRESFDIPSPDSFTSPPGAGTAPKAAPLPEPQALAPEPLPSPAEDGSALRPEPEPAPGAKP